MGSTLLKLAIPDWPFDNFGTFENPPYNDSTEVHTICRFKTAKVICETAKA